MMKRLVVLDVDDTLYLERDYVHSGFHAVDGVVSTKFGVEGFFATAWPAFLNGQRRTIFNQALQSLGVPDTDEIVSSLVQAYRTHTPTISLMPDAEEFLRLQRPEAHLAVITDGPVDSQRAKVEALGLPELVDAIILTGERGPDWGKPSPRAFTELQEQFGMKAADCTYYGDNPIKDFGGPALLGWNTVRIQRVGGLHFDAEPLQTVRTLEDFAGEIQQAAPA